MPRLAEGAEDGRGSPEVGPSGVEGAFWQSYFADLFVEHDEDSNGALDMQEFLKVMEVIAPTVAQEELKAAFMAADVDSGNRPQRHDRHAARAASPDEPHAGENPRTRDVAAPLVRLPEGTRGVQAPDL